MSARRSPQARTPRLTYVREHWASSTGRLYN